MYTQVPDGCVWEGIPLILNLQVERKGGEMTFSIIVLEMNSVSEFEISNNVRGNASKGLKRKIAIPLGTLLIPYSSI